MGLLASFSVIDDLGYPECTSVMGLPIDYSYGCEVFAETFESVAKDLVPVDTGKLRSSISASAHDDGCDCEADCEYAEYVEYGTERMGAQPYFEPAIEAAADEAMILWDEAVDMAEEEAMLLMEEEMTSEEMSGSGGMFNSGFGGFMGLILGAIIVGFVQGFFDMIRSAEPKFGGGGMGSKGVSVGGAGGGGSIPIEIT